MNYPITLALLLLITCQLTLQAGDAPDFLKEDADQLFRGRTSTIYNGAMELGVAGKPTPGYSLKMNFNRKTMDKDAAAIYIPVTRREKNGNRYLEVPGYQGLVEYKLEAEEFYLEKDGMVEVSLDAKIAPDVLGKEHPAPPIFIDFRCQDMNQGISGWSFRKVSDRFPVLKRIPFKPQEQWQHFSWKFLCKGGKALKYNLSFKVAGENTQEMNSSLCIDNLSVKYIDSIDSTSAEASFTPDRNITAYYPGDTAKYTISAQLPATETKQMVKVYVRTDYVNDIILTKEIELSRENEGKAGNHSYYTGKLSFPVNRYGSFNLISEWNGKYLVSHGGALIALHQLPKEVSAMQRKLGANYGGGGYYGATPSDESCLIVSHGGIERRVEIFELSGLRNAFCSLTFKDLMPAKDKIDFTATDQEYPLLLKHNIEPIPCIGSGTYNQPRHKVGNVLIGNNHPQWFFESKVNRIKHKAGKDFVMSLPEPEVWSFLINGLSRKYSQTITKWAIFREPQWVMSAQQLFDYQKTAYEIFKRDNPQAKILGCNATSDAGNNLTNWVEKMNKLGIGKYQDYLSFHPYEAGVDYHSGVRFKFSHLVERLKKIMPDQPLWNSELYFIPNSKREQLAGNKDDFAAGDVQRHYLLGLLNDLAGISAIQAKSLYRDYLNPSHVCAALNTVSFFLSGKDKLETVNPGNKLIRCGIFTGNTPQDYSATLWALQPSGASLTPAQKAQGVTLYDTYGNKLDWDASSPIPLGLDPIFLTGPQQELKTLLEKGKYSMGKSAVLRARVFQDKEVFYEVQNLSGGENIINLDAGGGCPPLRLHFKGSDFIRFSNDGKLSENFQAGLDGEKEISVDQTIILKDTGSYNVPADRGKPLTIAASEGSQFSFWTEKNRLYIRATVIDEQVTAAKSDDLYDADAIEIFIDRTPFARLDLSEHEKTNGSLAISQYVFSPKPSTAGISRLALDKSKFRPLQNSQASSTTTITPKGYTMTMEIPLAEISARTSAANIIGLNIELCRRNGEQKLPKETLTTSTQPSYKYRLHYPLFKLSAQSGNLLENGSAENGLTSWSSNKKSPLLLSDQSTDSTKAIMTRCEMLPDWSANLRKGDISCTLPDLAPGTYRLVFYAKGNKLNSIKVNIKGAKPLPSPISVSEKQIWLNNGDLPVSTRWSRYEFDFQVPQDLRKARLLINCTALRSDNDAYTIVDQCSLWRIYP